MSGDAAYQSGQNWKGIYIAGIKNVFRKHEAKLLHIKIVNPSEHSRQQIPKTCILLQTRGQ